MNSWIYLLLGLLDFISFSCMSYWLLHGVLVVFLVELMVTDSYDVFSWKYMLPISVLLLEDCFLYHRFGLILLFLLPVVMFVKTVKPTLSRPFFCLFPLVILLFAAFDVLLINTVVMGYKASFIMTMRKFFANLVVGIVAFWCLWGNRSLVTKERKVWTPHRQDAS